MSMCLFLTMVIFVKSGNCSLGLPTHSLQVKVKGNGSKFQWFSYSLSFFLFFELALHIIMSGKCYLSNLIAIEELCLVLMKYVLLY